MHSDDEAKNRNPITVTVNEACKLSGFGPTTIWKFLKDGRLKVRRVPGIDRTLILYSSLQELLNPSAQTLPPRRGRGRPRKFPAATQPEAAPEGTL